LDLLGIWKWIALGVPALVAVVIEMWASVWNLAPPVIVVLGIAAFADTVAPL
jgi:hypothetical protein